MKFFGYLSFFSLFHLLFCGASDFASTDEEKVDEVVERSLLSEVRGNNSERVLLLIEAGADVNERYCASLPFTPLMVATWNSREEMVVALLGRPDLDINAIEASGNTVLHLALFISSEEVVMRLLNDPRINVNAANYKGETPLHIAVVRAEFAFVKRLLEFPELDSLAVDSRGQTALQVAIETYPESHGLHRLMKKSIDLLRAHMAQNQV
jgi:hypothetical protein